MKLSGVGILVLGLGILGAVGIAPASAAEPGSDTDRYYEISTVTMQEIPDPSDYSSVRQESLSYEYNPGLIIGDVNVDEIVNLAKSIWKVIQDGKPVVSVKMDYATALPQGVSHWTALGGWKIPTTRTFRVAYQNGLGMNVVDFTFRVIFTHGGSYRGVGQYITNATVVPVNVDVAWGFTFNANAEASAIVNAGTVQEPVGAIQLDLHWSVDSVVKHNERTENFYLRGDGYFQQLGETENQ